jgi:hypothetical protein
LQIAFALKGWYATMTFALFEFQKKMRIFANAPYIWPRPAIMEHKRRFRPPAGTKLPVKSFLGGGAGANRVLRRAE